MSRIARIVLPDVPHHLTQRGNGRRAVFFQDQDRLLYIELLGRYAKQYRLDIHIHLAATPRRPDSLARAPGRTYIDAMAYTERNPVRSGMVEAADEYLQERDEAGILDLGAWKQQYDAARWREVLQGGVDEEALQAPRRGIGGVFRSAGKADGAQTAPQSAG